MTSLGFIVAILMGYFMKDSVVLKKKYRTPMWSVVFFAAMEWLQWAQYFVIDDCDNLVNKTLTVLAYTHICMQGYALQKGLGVLHDRPKEVQDFILKMCMWGGFVLWVRVLHPFNFIETTCRESDLEFFCAETTCSYSGPTHVAWKLYLTTPGYWMPSLSMHSFIFFGPCIFLKEWKTFLYMYVLIVPIYALIPTFNERPAIWCLFFAPTAIVMVIMMVLERRKMGMKLMPESENKQTIKIDDFEEVKSKTLLASKSPRSSTPKVRAMKRKVGGKK